MLDDTDNQEHDVIDNTRIRQNLPSLDIATKTEVIHEDVDVKMEYDIDIEEHDVTDNPRIGRILKSEIVDADNAEYSQPTNSLQEALNFEESHAINTQIGQISEEYTLHTSRTVLGNKHDGSQNDNSMRTTVISGFKNLPQIKTEPDHDAEDCSASTLPPVIILSNKPKNEINEPLVSDFRKSRFHTDSFNDQVNHLCYEDSSDDELNCRSEETGQDAPVEKKTKVNAAEGTYKNVQKEPEHLEEHLKLHGGQMASCSESNYVCTQVDERTQHLNTRTSLDANTNIENFSCDVCGCFFKHKYSLQCHTRMHNSEYPYSCDTCGKGFTLRGNLQNHIRHTDEKPCSCDICCKSFTEQSNLKKSNKIHTGEKQYSCETCGKKFARKENLRLHIRTHTGEKPYSCDTCGKRFTNSSNLKKHDRIHTGEKPYSCHFCGKRFTLRAHLRSHIRIHTGENPYSCDTCGKRFSQRGKLQNHIRIHTGEKSYSCDSCGKTFAQTDSLRYHIRTHTNRKPYSCDTCGKRFTKKRTLKEHNRIHTGENPFSCDTCGKIYTYQSSLKKHNKIHTRRKPFSCDTCGKIFKYQSSLKKHNMIHTGEKPSGRL